MTNQTANPKPERRSPELSRRALSRLLWAAAVSAALAACTKQPPPPPQAGPLPQPDPRHPGRFLLSVEGVLGTDANLMAVAPSAEAAGRMMAPAVARIRRIEGLMSTYRPDSEISRLNAAGPHEAVPLSPETMHVLQESVFFGKLTHGAFDVAYAPLRTLWRTAQERGSPPTEEEMRETLARVGSDSLTLTGDFASFAVEGMEVDLGGIAKGFAVDCALEEMIVAGARSALVDIGGDMRVVGRREDGQKWKVMVRDPREGGQDPMYLRLEDVAVATSGDYARFFRIGEEKYSHIIDPRTGRPVSAVPSATVVAPDAITADALATAVSVLGPAEGIELVDSMTGVECMIMAREENAEGMASDVSIHYSSGFRELMEPASEEK